MHPQQPPYQHYPPQQPGRRPMPGAQPSGGYVYPTGGHPQPSGQPRPPLPPPPSPKKHRKWPWLVLGVLVFFVIIVANGGKGGTPAPAATGPTPAVAAPAPAASAPTSYAGKGDDVVTITKDSGPAIVTFDCARCSGNTVLQSDGGDSLLVNTIGSYAGRHLIDGNDGSVTSTLTVKATGSWKITVASGIASAKRGDTSVSGRGDEVVVLAGKISKAAITNKGGDSNFVVQAYDSSGIPNLAVNTIGGYSGTVPIDGPAILAITSTGNWTVAGS